MKTVTEPTPAGITATVLAHSRNAANGVEIVSFLIKYHRFVHSEVMTFAKQPHERDGRQ